MKQKDLMKKLSVVLLAAAMTVSAFPQLSTQVFAEGKENELPTVEQFAVVSELKNFDTDETDGEENPAKVYFGRNGKQWWIAGSQKDDSMTLLARDALAVNVKYNANEDTKTDSKLWSDCYYLADTPTEVYANHYGASDVRKLLKSIEQDEEYFSKLEQEQMKTTKIYTEDYKLMAEGKTLQDTLYYTLDKLYLPCGFHVDGCFTVGENDMKDEAGLEESGLHVDERYWGDGKWEGVHEWFWLRMMNFTIIDPYRERRSISFARVGGDGWGIGYVTKDYELNPAFELDLSNVLFGSAIPSVSEEGTLIPENIEKEGAMTLRYKSSDLGSAMIASDKTEIELDNVAENTFLVVQNREKASVMSVSGTRSVNASEMGLDNFDNCQVWLEKTDKANRITYAVRAFNEDQIILNISKNTGISVITNSYQIVDKETSIADVDVKLEEGYYFSDDYLTSLRSMLEGTGLKVSRTDTGLTISGIPARNIDIKLPAAEEKVYSMTLTGEGTFPTVCEGYEAVVPNEFIIANYGNVDLENVTVSITGKDADKFELSGDNNTTIQPNGTITVTVEPKDSLAVNTYQATLTVAADDVDAVTADLQFIVNAHDYNEVVTPQTCTTGEYTTYTCKNCPYSYKGEEGEPRGHVFGEWVIIESPSCQHGGSRKHTCIYCNFEETENLNSAGHEWEDDYTVDKAPTCTEDGSRSIHCKNCIAVKDSQVITKLEHSFVKYASDKNATCMEDGTKTAKCERCDATDTIVDEGTKLGHDFKNYVSDKNATCMEDGTKTAKCERCDATDTIVDEGTKLGHDFKNYVSDKNATCMEDGTKTAKCERCDAIDMIVDEGTKLGHDFKNYVSDKNATCMEDGTKTAKCERCDATDTIVDEGTKLGHDFKNYVSDKNATCTKDGKETAKCERCDKTDTRVQENSALGHKMGEWKVIKNPTVTEAGEKERACERCDYKETKVIPMTADEQSIPPTKLDKQNDDAGSPKTGDQTNAGFVASLFTMSALGIAVLAVLRKKRMLDNR